MALDPLATADDLAAYGITWDQATEQDKVDRFLASASASIRDAAGVPISQTTSTVVLTVDPSGPDAEDYLMLPGPPVTAVASVLDECGAAVTGWKLSRGALWRRCGWVHHHQPTDWTVTFTHGLATVPEDVVAYVCVLVAGALAASRETDDGTGLAPDLSTANVRIDDFGEGYVDPADRLATPFEIPEHVRQKLRARFGGGSTVVSSR